MNNLCYRVYDDIFKTLIYVILHILPNAPRTAGVT